MLLRGFTSFVLLLFFYIDHYPLPSAILHILSSDTDVSKTIPFANLPVFKDLTVHQKDWLTHSGENDRPGEIYPKFSNSDNITTFFLPN